MIFQLRKCCFSEKPALVPTELTIQKGSFSISDHPQSCDGQLHLPGNLHAEHAGSPEYGTCFFMRRLEVTGSRETKLSHKTLSSIYVRKGFPQAPDLACGPVLGTSCCRLRTQRVKDPQGPLVLSSLFL